MYCPVGYTTIAELWDRFRKERLASYYVSATKHYHKPDFTLAFVRGSPLDICEHVFLKSVSRIGVCVASPAGRVLKLYSPLKDGRISLFSVMTPASSAMNALASENETGSTEIVDQIAGHRFQAWHGEHDEVELWRKSYPIRDIGSLNRNSLHLETLRFHCLPVCFERQGYKVVDKAPTWAEHLAGQGPAFEIASRFKGWSICMSDEKLEDWRPYLEGKPVYKNDVEENAPENSVGRPSKQGQALIDWDMALPNGFDGGMKVALRKIKAATGNTYSESTMRRALRNRSETNADSE